MQLLFSSGLISVLYTLPIFGKSMRLRDFSFIKIFLIAFVWAFVTESIPLYESGISLKWIVILFVERVAFFIAITIPFDIRDLKLDLTNNVKTLPSILGIRRSTYVALFLLMYCIGSEIYLDTNGIEGCIPTILAYILTGILLYRVYKKDNDYYFSGLMDGTIMLPWILMKILS
jgi:4-hydroxybenzoate polyprenyltransferase